MRKNTTLCRFGMGYAGSTWPCATVVQTIAHDWRRAGCRKSRGSICSLQLALLTMAVIDKASYPMFSGGYAGSGGLLPRSPDSLCMLDCSVGDYWASCTAGVLFTSLAGTVKVSNPPTTNTTTINQTADSVLPLNCLA